MGKKLSGVVQAKRMKGIVKGGLRQACEDGFDRSSPLTLASLADQWLQWLRERNYSAQTVAVNHWSLKMFLTWSHERNLAHPQAITKPILESYQRYVYRYRKGDGSSLSFRTQRMRLGTLQRFFSYLCKESYLLANPASDLELPRKPYPTLPKALSMEELRRLMGQIDVTDVMGLRDRTILEMFYATGMRRSELIRLDQSDVDCEQGCVYIRQGKGGKGRLLPLSSGAIYWIELYLEKSRPVLSLHTQEQAFFLSGYGERFSPGYLGNWVSRQMKAAGIEKKGACHLLRHSCATHMLENGADIRIIQQLLGHARLDTTQIYTEVSLHTLREVYNRTHPSNQKK